MKNILLISIFYIITISLSAQRSTDEMPFGLKEGFKMQAIEKVVLKSPDLERIKKEDLENDLKHGPLRYACSVMVKYTTENSGVWQQFDDGSKIWRLKVNLPGALSTNTYYNRFWIPEGSSFFVYNEKTNQYIGAIISEFIEGSKENPIKFATSLIFGEDVIYEYYQPASVKDQPDILISSVMSAFT